MRAETACAVTPSTTLVWGGHVRGKPLSAVRKRYNQLVRFASAGDRISTHVERHERARGHTGATRCGGGSRRSRQAASGQVDEAESHPSPSVELDPNARGALRRIGLPESFHCRISNRSNRWPKNLPAIQRRQHRSRLFQRPASAEDRANRLGQLELHRLTADAMESCAGADTTE